MNQNENFILRCAITGSLINLLTDIDELKILRKVIDKRIFEIKQNTAR